MVIECIVRGQVLTRADVPDEYLELEGASWERAVEFREEVIRLQLLQLRQKVESYFKTGIQVEYRLVFQSKMHMIDDNEESTTTDAGGDRLPNQSDAQGDPAAAAQ